MDFEDYEREVQGLEKDMLTKEPKKKKISVWKVLWGIFRGCSVLFSIFMFLVFIAVIVLIASKGKIDSVEQVIKQGEGIDKIAVIKLKGLIDDRQMDDFSRQLKAARRDMAVKGIIVRVDSPGGRVSSSDQIHHLISKYREETQMPVISFMQGIAASGGYYASVACDEIIAEPTVITGSVGVIMSYLVVQELLEEKLGIEPVVVKAGRRKDWPSPFSQLTDEQRQYLEEKVIQPSYERFVQLIADGREELTIDEVRTLADGSIYTAQEALENKLIDQIGYFDDAVALVEELAGVEDARIVEYERPFSIAYLLSGEARGFEFDRDTIYEAAMPRLMYLFGTY